MFGSEYSSNPSILLSSFGEMHATYKKKIKKAKENKILTFTQKAYIKIFGIPEIGFQVRSMYFEEIVKAKLKSKKFDRILDAGSGIGAYSFWLAKKYPKANIIGGDIDRDKLDFSRNFTKELNLSNVSFKYFDILSTGKDRTKYDLIVNIDILEHVHNYKKALKNFHELLVPNGYLYVHTPQPNQTRIFKKLESWSHEEHVHEGYSPEELKSQLEKLGFKVIVLRQTFGFFGKAAWELNHITIQKSFILSGFMYPLLYGIASLDLLFDNKHGLGTAILAKKV